MALSTPELLAILVVQTGNIAVWGKMIWDNKQNKKNGNSKFCSVHAAVESRTKTIEESMGKLHDENRQDHGNISSKIDALNTAVSNASAAAAAAAAAAAIASRRKKQ